MNRIMSPDTEEEANISTFRTSIVGLLLVVGTEEIGHLRRRLRNLVLHCWICLLHAIANSLNLPWSPILSRRFAWCGTIAHRVGECLRVWIGHWRQGFGHRRQASCFQRVALDLEHFGKVEVLGADDSIQISRHDCSCMCDESTSHFHAATFS